MQEMQIRSLGQEAPLEKEMATHSGILAWKIPWTGEPGGLQSMGSQRFGHDLVTKQQQLQHHLLQGAFPELHMFKQLFPWVQTIPGE